MLPETSDITFGDITSYESQSSKTYKVISASQIRGTIDQMNSVIQAVDKILRTERFAYEIYDSNYGAELEQLIGKDYGYIKTVLPKLVEEALLQDDRILQVRDFTFERLLSDTMSFTCQIDCIFSTFSFTKELVI